MYHTIVLRMFSDQKFFPMIHKMHYGGDINIFNLEYSNLCWVFSKTFFCRVAIGEFRMSNRSRVMTNLVSTRASVFFVYIQAMNEQYPNRVRKP